ASRRRAIQTGHAPGPSGQGMSDETWRKYSPASIAPMNFQLSFDRPITWRGLEQELDAYVELWDSYPAVIVIDNLMDIEGCESDYSAQMAAMQDVTELAPTTGATAMPLQHATHKGWEGRCPHWRL